jgi:hypothetical protein
MESGSTAFFVHPREELHSPQLFAAPTLENNIACVERTEGFEKNISLNFILKSTV